MNGESRPEGRRRVHGDGARPRSVAALEILLADPEPTVPETAPPTTADQPRPEPGPAPEATPEVGKQPSVLPWALLALSAAPLPLAGLDLDFGVTARGGAWHAVLEWSAVCTACFAALLAALGYWARRDSLLGAFGVVLAVAASLDAAHALAAPADPGRFLPLSWAISRSCFALLLVLSAGALRWRPFLLWSLAAGGASQVIVWACAGSRGLPESRLFLLVAPALLVGAAAAFLRRNREESSRFPRVLLLSLIPQTAAELYIALGAAGPLDDFALFAHWLKLAGYLVLAAGWSWEGARLQRDQGQTLEQLQRERQERFRRTEEARPLEEDSYRLAVEGANDGHWQWDLAASRIHLSSRWKSMLGYEAGDIGTRPEDWFERVHPDDVDRLKADISAHFEQSSSHFETEHRIWHKDGSYRWVLTRGVGARDAQGRPCRVAGSLTDIAPRKDAEQRLAHEAFHDSLTGLENRTLFLSRLRHAMALAKRRRSYLFALMYLDLDRFKVVNDSLGHLAGDELLLGFARRLKTCVREADTVARLGGDEFTILLEDVRDAADAVRVAIRIEQEMKAPFHLGGQQVFTTTSIGIAMGGSDCERPEDLLRDADTALYHAKEEGRARHQIFDRAMHARAVQLLQLETELRQAVREKEFRVQYQPIISLADGRIRGFEALVRWNHPQRGLIAPAQFIPLAEETGLIVPMGEWVLRQACAQAGAWRVQFPGEPPLWVNVNLSARQFAQKDLIERIDQVLEESSLEGSCLGLEITESALMQNEATTATTLRRLRARHIQLHIDDFGTGYSSLSCLRQLPIDSLKIDCSFVGGMESDNEKLEIASTILALAHNLGKPVVAEGIETPEQLSLLRGLSCEYGQGFLFSQALEAGAAADLVAARSQW